VITVFIQSLSWHPVKQADGSGFSGSVVSAPAAETPRVAIVITSRRNDDGITASFANLGTAVISERELKTRGVDDR